MFIRKKTDEEIRKDVCATKRDIKMGVLRDDLYWALTRSSYPKYLKKNKILQKQRNLFEKDWVLVLRVCQNKLNSNNTTTWMHSTVANTIIEFWKYKQYLHLHKKLVQKDIKDLKILIQHDNGSYEIDIPAADKNNMLTYLIDGVPPVEFDCQSFIHAVKWVKMRQHGENISILPNKWCMYEKKINELRSWDCVCLFKYFENQRSTYGKVQHFAYYLWNGLFISKFWANGSVCISSLQEMHDFYWTKEFVYMSPNTFHEDVNIHNPRFDFRDDQFLKH